MSEYRGMSYLDIVAKLEKCKDINGGITTENIRLVEKNAELKKEMEKRLEAFKKYVKWHEEKKKEVHDLKDVVYDLKKENARLRKAGQGLAKFLKYIQTGTDLELIKRDRDRMKEVQAKWREACDE